MNKLWMIVLMWPGMAAAGGLAPDVAKAILQDPGAYLDTATAMIAGYGQDGRLGPDGIALMLDAKRAKARATALAALMAADLDGDGAVTVGEQGKMATIASATERGRLAKAVLRAETDGTPGLSAAELVSYGQAVAAAAVPALDQARLQALLQFDANGDGAVTRDEVKAGVDRMVQQAAPQARHPGV
jgi:hypothetical protein